MTDDVFSTKSKTIFSLTATTFTFLLAIGLNVVQKELQNQDDSIISDQQDFQVPLVLLPQIKLLRDVLVPVLNEYGENTNDNLLSKNVHGKGTNKDLLDFVPDQFKIDQTIDKNKNALTRHKDPKIQLMKGIDGVADFDAYVSESDVSAFYGEELGSRTEYKPIFTGMASKFVNLYPYRVSLYWSGTDKTKLHQSDINPWGSAGTSSFPNQTFMMTSPGDPDHILCIITTNTESSVYYCDPFEALNISRIGMDNEDELMGYDASSGKIISPITPMDLNELAPQDKDAYDIHQYNRQFSKHYRKFTGSEWLALYPPILPKHNIWSATRLGQIHTVQSRATHLVKLPSTIPQSLSIDEMRISHINEVSTNLHDDVDSNVNLTLKVLSVEPRIFEIRNFLSNVEVDHILDILKPKRLLRSRTGNAGDDSISETRTSTTTWIPRHTDAIINRIFLRVSDALEIDEAMLRPRNDNDDKTLFPELTNDHDHINEDLQIVHYNVGEQYTAHHDFGYPKNVHDKLSRSINLCMYLNDVPAGGETSFPRWRNGETGNALNVKPEKGKAVIFYMIKPDGNLDDFTQHAALPVIEGEKYFANLWIHSY